MKVSLFEQVPYRYIPDDYGDHNSSVVTAPYQVVDPDRMHESIFSAYAELLHGVRSGFDGIVAVSELDKQVLERDYGARNVHAVPTGVDTDFFRPHPEPPEENNLVFLGAMDWLPNEDGILFFADEVLPRLRKLVPTAHITVVGRNPSPKLLKRTRLHPEIRVVGRVEDVRRHVARGALFVIPLRIGGGTRIKAYEAQYGARWKIAPLIEKLAAEGGTFAGLDAKKK